MTSIRKQLNKKLNTLDDLTVKMRELGEEIEGKASKHIANCEKAQIIIQKAATLSQEHLAAHLSGIVTQAVQAVIDKPYEFVCEFVERRGSAEADLYLRMDGERYEILESTGGGLADVCSFSLKIAYLLLSNVDRVLIIDEVSRHINSSAQRERFAEVMSRLSKELDIQLIINSAVPEFIAVADNVIRLEQNNGITRSK